MIESKSIVSVAQMEAYEQVVSKLQMKKAIPICYKEPEQAMMAIMKGAELGFVGAATALEAFIPINGNLTLKEPVANALLLSKGIYVEVLKDCEPVYRKDKDGVEKLYDYVTTLRMNRPMDGGHLFSQTASFSLRDATEAELSGKDVWKKWKKQMLYWRCFGLLADRMASDILCGLKTTQQLHHLDENIEINFNGNQPEYSIRTETVTTSDEPTDIEYEEVTTE